MQWLLLVLWDSHRCTTAAQPCRVSPPAKHCHHFALSHKPLSPCRRSTRWWAPWSWWRWTRTAWRQSSGWTRSSPRWTRTTTTRSHWRSSKRRPRATRPSYYCCSATSRNKPEGGSAAPAATDCTERISCSIQFAAISTEKKKINNLIIICLDYLSMDLLLCLKHSCAWECYLL